MLRWIKRILAPPVFEGDADKSRAAWLLNIILITLIARSIVIRLITGTDPPRPSFVIPFVVLLLLMMVLMRRGDVQAASVITIAGFWLSLSAAAVVTGGLHSTGFRNYILPVIVAGLLLGQRGAIATAAMSILAGIGMWIAEVNNLIEEPPDSTGSLELLVTHAISLLMAAVLVTLATRSIEQALQRARNEILDRKQAEQAVRASEERFSRAFNLSPVRMGILRLSDNIIVAVNDCFVSDLGFDRSEIVGHSVLDLPRWIGRETPRIKKLLDEGIPVRNWEGVASTKTGEQRITLLSTEKIELDGEPCLLWVSNDITERKRAEDALRESEELFRTSFENATAGVCLISTDGKFVSANRMLCEMLGYSESELKQMSFNDVTPREDWSIGSTFVARALAGEVESANLEKRYLKKDGHVFWAFVSTALVRRPDNRPHYFITYIQDITERRLAEEQIQATSQQLRALMTSLRSAREAEGIRIAREIHDELGSALTSLRWDLEDLERTVSELESVKHRAALKGRISTMQGVVDSTVDVVRRISSELRPSVLDDLGLAAAVEWQAQQFQARTGIVCRYDCSVDPLDLDNEQATAVFRIFQEALTNVLRHAQATRIDVSLDMDENDLVLSIQDNGRGIRDAEKTGQASLGLLGMRERASLIGASVEITGVDGRGTSVSLRIPHLRSKTATTA